MLKYQQQQQKKTHQFAVKIKKMQFNLRKFQFLKLIKIHI